VLEADTLTADLTFYENGEVRVLWPAAEQFRGVSEGDVIRYALRREEPLKLEHEAFIDLLEGRRAEQLVSVEEGLEVVAVAEAVLESARAGRTVALRGANEDAAGVRRRAESAVPPRRSQGG